MTAISKKNYVEASRRPKQGSLSCLSFMLFEYTYISLPAQRARNLLSDCSSSMSSRRTYNLLSDNVTMAP